MSELNQQIDPNNVVSVVDPQSWINSIGQAPKNEILIPKNPEGIQLGEMNNWVPLDVESSISKRIIRHPWSTEEDEQLKILVNELGTNNWHELARHISNRSARQCRDRWNSYLNPDLNLSAWTAEEDNLLLTLYSQLGKKWTLIAQKFPHRTTNSIKNRIKVHSRRLKKEHKIDGDPLSLGPIIGVPFDMLKMDVKDVDSQLPVLDPTSALSMEPPNQVPIQMQSLDNVEIPNQSNETLLQVPSHVERNVQ